MDPHTNTQRFSGCRVKHAAVQYLGLECRDALQLFLDAQEHAADVLTNTVNVESNTRLLSGRGVSHTTVAHQHTTLQRTWIQTRGGAVSGFVPQPPMPRRAVTVL